ncbi:MAG: alpha/beta hydrolase family protein [Bacteroidia bacterium]
MEKSFFLKKEITIDGKHQRPITLDINYMSNEVNQPLVVFCHGFKGFKDWGTFNKMAETFAHNNFVFIKFNFSHNGTTPGNYTDIHDTEAFGHNNFEIELEDLDCVINWLEREDNPYKKQYNFNKLYLIGHSRGGGIAMLKTTQDGRVKKVAAWASVNDFEKYMYLSDPINWQETGVSYIENTRTGISLPLYYQFYENFYKNKGRLDIKENLMSLDKPILLLHGTMDETVAMADSEWIYENLDHSILVKVENANHTFGASHPWEKESLPENLSFALEETIEFFNF